MEQLEGYSVSMLPLYEMMYGIFTSVLIIGAIYLLITPFGKKNTIPARKLNARIKGGICILTWGLSYILHFYLILSAIRHGNPLDNSTIVVVCFIELGIMLSAQVVLIFSLVRARIAQVIILSIISLTTVSFSIWYYLTENRNIIAYYTNCNIDISILVIIMFGLAYRRYSRWLEENFSDTDSNDARWTQGLPLFMIVQSAVFFVRILMPDIRIEILGDVVNLGYELYLMINLDGMLKSTSPQDEMGAESADENGIQDGEFATENEEETADESQGNTVESTIPVDIMEDNKTQIGRRLMRYCIKDQLYLQPGLTSAQLSRAIGINRSYMSHYFTEHGTSFYGYINGLRINHAIRIMEKSNGEQSLLSIASQSGFNSLNTFNRAFKDYMNTTPGDYYENVLNVNNPD